MANPVTEDITSWQNDATASDSNLPVSGSNAGIGQNQDLSGNLRLLKSEMRNEGVNKSWERWKGLKNLAASGNIAFTFVGATQFSVNDDFTNASRKVAVVNRRVRAFITGSTLYGTITAASVSVGVTTVTVAWDSGALDGTLTEVEFGPELRSFPPTLTELNTIGSSIAVAATLNLDAVTGDFVDVTGNGTVNNITLTPGMEVRTRFLGNCTITQTGNLLLGAGGSVVSTVSGDLLTWRGIFGNVVLVGTQKGTQNFNVPGYARLPGGLIIQWDNVTTNGSSAATFSFPLQFPNNVIGVWAIDKSGDTGRIATTGAASIFSCPIYVRENDGTAVMTTAFCVAIGW